MQLRNQTSPELPRAESYLATGIIVKKDNNILLLYRSSTGYFDNVWALPGGKCDQGESIFATATREGYEEIGIQINQSDLQLMHIIHHIDQGIGNWVLFFFLIESWHGEIINQEPHKHSALQWFPIDQLPDNMLPTHKQALQGWSNNTRCSIFPG